MKPLAVIREEFRFEPRSQNQIRLRQHERRRRAARRLYGARRTAVPHVEGEQVGPYAARELNPRRRLELRLHKGRVRGFQDVRVRRRPGR